MKTASLLLLIIAWAGVMHGQSPDASAHNSYTRLTKVMSTRGPGDKRPQQARNKQLSPGAKEPNHGIRKRVVDNAMRIEQSGVSNPLGIANSSATRGRTVGRPPIVAGLSGEQFKDAPRRRSSPAIIGESMNAAKNNAAIGGTKMKHKP